MSRRRNRGPRPESIVPAEQAATPVAPVSSVQPPNRHERRRQEAHPAPAFVFSRPVVVDPTKADIDDFVLISQIGMLSQTGTEQEAHAFLMTNMEAIHGLLNRVVKDGTKGRPAAEFMPLLTEVLTQIGSRKN